MANNNQGMQGDSQSQNDFPNQGNQNPSENLSNEDRSKGGSMSGGNFKNDPERASEAGQDGGSK